MTLNRAAGESLQSYVTIVPTCRPWSRLTMGEAFFVGHLTMRA